MRFGRVEVSQQFVANDRRAGFAAAIERPFECLLRISVEMAGFEVSAHGGNVVVFAGLAVCCLLKIRRR